VRASPAPATASGTTIADAITTMTAMVVGGLASGLDVIIHAMDVTTIAMTDVTMTDVMTTNGTIIAVATVETTSATYAFFQRARTSVD
jgi:hypothetical protein